MEDELASQPRCWRRAAELQPEVAGLLPRPGERVAVAGCGSSRFMAMAYAGLRESAGHGVTDAFAASEPPAGRDYQRLIALTRSGTTTEVLRLLAAVRGTLPTVAITADPRSPVAEAADAVIGLDFADERAVVATRSSTSALALLRASLGEDMEPVAAQAAEALSIPLDGLLDGLLDGSAATMAASPADGSAASPARGLVGAEQVTFLGRGWAVGLAHDAALKLREAAGAWTESYPAMEYRHGPISIAQPGRVVWMFGVPPPGLADEVADTGATFLASAVRDPMVHLVLAHRLAVAMAAARGLDPDRPRHLSRSVVLKPMAPHCPS